MAEMGKEGNTAHQPKGALTGGTRPGGLVVLNVLSSYLEWFGSGHGYRAAADILYPMLGFTLIFSSLIV